jgi:Immunoglobulin I-set domain
MDANTRLKQFLFVTTVLLIAITPAHSGVSPFANPQAGYDGFTQHYFLPYASDPGFGGLNPQDPEIKLTFDGVTRDFPLDTGSRALYLSADALPANISLNGPTGFVYLNSSARIFSGTWTSTNVTFPDAVGYGGANGTATATMLVLVVQSLTCSAIPPPGTETASTTFSTIPESGNVTLVDRAKLAFSNHVLTLTPGQVAAYADNVGILGTVENFGVGFDRTGLGTSPNNDQYNQQYNAFFSLAQMRAGTMIAGYILTPTGVQLGLTENTTGFAYTNLVPTGLSQIPRSPPDWQAPMGTMTYNGKTYPAGQVVLDIGIPHGILTLPGQPTSGTTVALPMGVNLINSGGSVGYQINNATDNILNPTSISWFAPLDGNFSENQPPYQAQLFNTGRFVINAFDLLYDGTNGYLGVEPNGVAVPSANIRFTAGFYPNPLSPTAPFVTTQPANQGFNVGSHVTFTARARGNPSPAYQWQVSAKGAGWKNIANGTVYRGATTSSLLLRTTVGMSGSKFRVVVSNSAGQTASNAALLIRGARPAMITQPVALTVSAGRSASFTVVAAGSPPLWYAWYFDSQRLTNSGNVAGANSSTLRLTRVADRNAGYYQAIVINPIGAVASQTVPLDVQ